MPAFFQKPGVQRAIRNRKVQAAALVAVVACVGLAGGALLLYLNGHAAETYDVHFTVTDVACQPVFVGENVIVTATVLNDEPEREIAVPTTTELVITPAPDDTSGVVEVTAVPTTVVEMVPATGSHTLTARLSGGNGADVVRYHLVSMATGQFDKLTFDFGRLPAGEYVVTVTAPSYNESRRSLAVRVNPSPLLGEWTQIGDVAFDFVNLGHDGVDVKIRNDGEHTVTFSGSQYAIFANCSGRDGMPLQGLEKTIVTPGATATVHATIPIPGDYYLEGFAIRSPEKTGLVRVPVNASMITH